MASSLPEPLVRKRDDGLQLRSITRRKSSVNETTDGDTATLSLIVFLRRNLTRCWPRMALR